MVEQIAFGTMLMTGYQHTLSPTKTIEAAAPTPPKYIGGLGRDTIEFKGPAAPLQKAVNFSDPTGLKNMPNPFGI